MRHLKLAALFLLCPVLIFANSVVESRPVVPTISDSIVIVFHADRGNQGLKDNSGDIWAHTGVITSASASGSDWKYVAADWSVNLDKCKLTYVETNTYELVIGNIYRFYGITDSAETILKLAFVFRNANGSKQGKDVGNQDIFLSVYQDKPLLVNFLSPENELLFSDMRQSPVFLGADTTLNVSVIISLNEGEMSGLELWMDSLRVDSLDGDTLNYLFVAGNWEHGPHCLMAIAHNELEMSDTAHCYLMINPPVSEALRPDQAEAGIHIIDDSTVVLIQFAPYKNYIYAIGDFNQWIPDTAYYFYRDNDYFWLRLRNLDPLHEYAYQLLIDGDRRIADPYAEKILDGSNDPNIPASVYPDLKAYPLGQTKEIVSVLQTRPERYEFKYSEAFTRPPQEELVIYELHVRDFLEDHSISTLVDTLEYLKNLGINAIELMPFNEFEGNSSWGYNPSFYFAPDKYYGRKIDYQRFIDECHRLGIAVIQDMVLNHAFGQSAWVRMYVDLMSGQMAAQNPWFNVVAPHEYSWGYDFNHESLYTQHLVDQILAFWVTEYRVDGFRLDFTKGFTNKPGSGWNYDASRVAILQRIKDQINVYDSSVYLILEHWADNNEEKALANAGFMLWGHANASDANWGYYEAAMGYYDQNKSDISWGFYQTRGWDSPHLVTYMESHDEERLMVKTLQWGNGDGAYQIKDTAIALERMKAVAAFFLTLPGPKMIWQFGELGYDYSIDYNSRTGEKPIRWDYYHHANRWRLYKTYSALLKIRAENELFRQAGTNISLSVTGAVKRINLSNDSLKAVILGNFDVTAQSGHPYFSHSGWWYDFFPGDSIWVESINAPIALNPGEFHIYTSKRLSLPDSGLITLLDDGQLLPVKNKMLLTCYPNPFNARLCIEALLPYKENAVIEIVNVLGQRIRRIHNDLLSPKRHSFYWDGLNDNGESAASGIYFLRINTASFHETKKLLLLK